MGVDYMLGLHGSAPQHRLPQIKQAGPLGGQGGMGCRWRWRHGLAQRDTLLLPGAWRGTFGRRRAAQAGPDVACASNCAIAAQADWLIKEQKSVFRDVLEGRRVGGTEPRPHYMKWLPPYISRFGGALTNGVLIRAGSMLRCCSCLNESTTSAEANSTRRGRPPIRTCPRRSLTTAASAALLSSKRMQPIFGTSL
mmetsp:Transcript_31432/g.94434  ORF Transcript_31432/g.94434 Transcript_31432/m.94434 type:complete len:195 (+) Transcript_31432:678-1262(+)